MKIIIVAVGTPGDVYPLIGLGHTLLSQQHEVYFLTSENYVELANSWGMRGIGILSNTVYQQTASNKDLYHPRHCVKVFMEGFILPSLQTTYNIIKQLVTKDNTLIIGHFLSLPAKIAAEALKISFISIHLAPIGLRSNMAPSKPPGFFAFDRLPYFCRKWITHVADRYVSKVSNLEAFNQFREKLGLKRIATLFENWIYEADKIIGLFPEWFSGLPADWPNNLKITNFILFNPYGRQTLSNALQTFLTNNRPTILFTAGSLSLNNNHFFRKAIVACQQLDCQGLLVCKDQTQLPDHLPSNILAVDYVPFMQVLPFLSTIVHHGGIGTSAKASAHAVPQLIIPRYGDQFDNARRYCQLGVALQLSPHLITHRALVHRLRKLLTDPAIHHKCKHYAELIRRGDDLTVISSAILQVAADLTAVNS